MLAPQPSKDFNPIQDIIDCVKKVKAKGEVPDTIQVHPSWLNRKNLPKLIAFCEHAGIELKLTYKK